jgi:hypothetical protein
MVSPGIRPDGHIGDLEGEGGTDYIRAVRKRRARDDPMTRSIYVVIDSLR